MILIKTMKLIIIIIIIIIIILFFNVCFALLSRWEGSSWLTFCGIIFGWEATSLSSLECHDQLNYSFHWYLFLCNVYSIFQETNETNDFLCIFWEFGINKEGEPHLFSRDHILQNGKWFSLKLNSEMLSISLGMRFRQEYP